MTFNAYRGSLPSPDARASDLNRLTTYLRTWLHRKAGLPLCAVWVWHSAVTGRTPHVHVFLHCPKRHREGLREALDEVYPEPNVIDVREGSATRKLHHSGFWGSTLDYMMRFQSQKAWVGGRRQTYRETYRDPETGRRKGVRAPIEGKRWGCSRNISKTAIETRLHWEAKGLLLPTPPGAVPRSVTG